MSEKFSKLNDDQRSKLTQFLDVREESGRTALFLAAEANRVKCADVLLRYKASTEVTNHKNITPLGVACDQGHTSMILLLIENHARCDIKVGDKSLLDCIATSIKDPREKCEVTKALLANGAQATEEELKKIGDSLGSESHKMWTDAVSAAREARAKNFTKAIGGDAPVPTNDMQDAPMDEISKFLGFDQPLLRE